MQRAYHVIGYSTIIVSLLYNFKIGCSYFYQYQLYWALWTCQIKKMTVSDNRISSKSLILSKLCFMGQGLRWLRVQLTQFTRIKSWNITNNNIVPVNQASREQFLGNAISGVLWRNNRTNIEPATFHLAGNCIRYWIRCCQEHKHYH